MKRFIPLAAAAALIAAPVLAVEPAPGAQVGVSVTEIAAALSADGYEVRKYDREDDKIEVTAIKGDQRVEFYVDPATGLVTRAKSRTRYGAGRMMGVTDDEIRATLTADGYEIRKYERERGQIEIKAMKDGARYEFDIDARTGALTEMKEKN